MLRNYFHNHDHTIPIGKMGFCVVVVYICIKIIDLVHVSFSTWLLTQGF